MLSDGFWLIVGGSVGFILFLHVHSASIIKVNDMYNCTCCENVSPIPCLQYRTVQH